VGSKYLAYTLYLAGVSSIVSLQNPIKPTSTPERIAQTNTQQAHTGQRQAWYPLSEIARYHRTGRVLTRRFLIRPGSTAGAVHHTLDKEEVDHLP